jgi:hypothetical protein
MDKKKTIVYLVAFYLVFLWLGFRAGEMYARMKNKLTVEKITVSEDPHTQMFYVVEKEKYGDHTNVKFSDVDSNDVLIKFLYNDKLKPLIKLRDVEIYDSEGERVY